MKKEKWESMADDQKTMLDLIFNVWDEFCKHFPLLMANEWRCKTEGYYLNITSSNTETRILFYEI